MSLDTAPPAVPAPRHPDTPDHTGATRTPAHDQVSPDPVSPDPVSADPARTLLAGYPHAARCPACLTYTRTHHGELPGIDLLIAVLAHHDTGHRHDPLTASSQHFRPLR